MTTVKSNALDEWFRGIGTQLSDEDYEAGILAIQDGKAEAWDEGFTVADHWNGAPLDEGGSPIPTNPYRPKEN